MERYCYKSKDTGEQRYIHRYTWLSSQHTLYQDAEGSTVGLEANPARDVCVCVCVCVRTHTRKNGQLRLLLTLFFVCFETGSQCIAMIGFELPM